MKALYHVFVDVFKNIVDFAVFAVYLMLVLGGITFAYFQINGGNPLFVEFPDGISAMGRLAFNFLDFHEFDNDAVGGWRGAARRWGAGGAGGLGPGWAAGAGTLDAGCWMLDAGCWVIGVQRAAGLPPAPRLSLPHTPARPPPGMNIQWSWTRTFLFWVSMVVLTVFMNNMIIAIFNSAYEKWADAPAWLMRWLLRWCPGRRPGCWPGCCGHISRRLLRSTSIRGQPQPAEPRAQPTTTPCPLDPPQGPEEEREEGVLLHHHRPLQGRLLGLLLLVAAALVPLQGLLNLQDRHLPEGPQEVRPGWPDPAPALLAAQHPALSPPAASRQTSVQPLRRHHRHPAQAHLQQLQLQPHRQPWAGAGGDGAARRPGGLQLGRHPGARLVGAALAGAAWRGGRPGRRLLALAAPPAQALTPAQSATPT
jgi:hypothetical protein